MRIVQSPFLRLLLSVWLPVCTLSYELYDYHDWRDSPTGVRKCCGPDLAGAEVSERGKHADKDDREHSAPQSLLDTNHAAEEVSVGPVPKSSTAAGEHDPNQCLFCRFLSSSISCPPSCELLFTEIICPLSWHSALPLPLGGARGIITIRGPPAASCSSA